MILDSSVFPLSSGDSGTDPYAANVSFLFYCDRNLVNNNQSTTDSTGKTVKLLRNSTPPSRCFIAGDKRGAFYIPGFSDNSSAFGNYAEIPGNNSAFWFGSGNWTMEFLCNSSNWYNDNGYFGIIFWVQRNASDQYGILFDYYNNNLRLTANLDYANTKSFPWTPVNNTNYYIAIRRSGNDISCAVNGVQVGTTHSWSGITLNNVTSPNRFGGDSFNNHGECIFNGIRITKGVARDIFNPDTLPWVY